MLVACNSSLDDKVLQLVKAKNNWLDYVGNNDYSFVLVKHCDCHHRGQKILIIVKNQKIISAEIYNESINKNKLYTMRGLFELILEIIKDQEQDSTIISTIKYHEIVGYPTEITIISSEREWHNKTTLHVSEVKLSKM